MKFELKDNELIISISGRLASDTMPQVEEELNNIRENNEHEKLTIDLLELEYTSSAGLRLFLKLAKSENDFRIINVNNDVYDVFEMTGFSDMIKIEKGHRVISLDGAEMIGEGCFSEVYRIDKDTIAKRFFKDVDFENVNRELKLAKEGFVLGLPTAISYDAVWLEGKPGIVFEMLDCDSLRDAIKKHPENYDNYMKDYAKLLKILNTTDVADTILPDAKKVAFDKVEKYKEKIPNDVYVRIKELLGTIPEDRTFIHGDCQVKNIMINNGEMLLIDMDTLSVGNPIFEWATIYAAYKLFFIYNPHNADFFGLSNELIDPIYDAIFNYYFENCTEEEKKDNFMKIRVTCEHHMLWWLTSFASDGDEAFEKYLELLKEDMQKVNDLKLIIK